MNIVKFWLTVVVLAFTALTLGNMVPAMVNRHNDGSLVLAAVLVVVSTTFLYVYFKHVLPKL